MPRAPTAKRYAQAAFEIAREHNEIDRWLEDLQAALPVLEDQTFRSYMGLPTVKSEVKLRAIGSALGDVNPLVRNLVALLASRNGLELYPRVVTEYQRFVDRHRNRERATVVTAVPLEEREKERVNQELARLLGKEVVLTTQVHPQILGGLVAQVGDRLIDGSTRGRLLGLRKSLMESAG